jgi:hypothetical protein
MRSTSATLTLGIALVLVVVPVACGDGYLAPPDVLPDWPRPQNWPRPDTVADQAAPDVKPETVAPADIGIDFSGGCPGGAGCKCANDGACVSKACLDGGTGLACAAPCDASHPCEAGVLCLPIPGTKASACIDTRLRLCNPCGQSSDCALPGLGEAACVDHGAAGWYCGVPCSKESDCLQGYACQQRKTSEGDLRLQCVPAAGAGGGEPGACVCSPYAIKRGLSTVCHSGGGAAGAASCSGTRKCTATGLSACDAPLPASETCNDKDDDCDGQIDEGLCSDGNPCTLETCVVATGGCQFPLAPTGGACSDGNACTVNDICVAGKCQAGAQNGCNDLNPCTVDQCFPTAGCSSKVVDGLVCDADGNKCTVTDACKGGGCQPGKAFSCDDGNPCSSDACDPDSGTCSHVAVPADVTCTDSSVCTSGDHCADGSCVGQPVACDDGNACSADACEPVQGCVHAAASGSLCDDGNPCSLADTCAAGVCQAGAAKACPAQAPCQIAACNTVTGACAVVPAAATPCDDANPCTAGESCAAGACVGGKAANCDDGNTCTTDYCVPTSGCASAPAPAACEEGSLCTAGDQCQGGTCVAGKTAVCGDGLPCTIDICLPASGTCTHAATEGPCSDGNACTTEDACAGVACIGLPIVCSDGNPCTVDFCTATGCQSVAKPVPCDDGDACTLFDTCKGGSCAPGMAKACSDGNPCTADACAVDLGCVHTPTAGACDDGNPCTTGDNCVAAACKSGQNLCACKDSSVCAKFEDGDMCNGTLACVSGLCVLAPETVVTCPEPTPCMFSTCVPETGQCATKAAPDGLACADGKACTVADACKAGACLGSAAPCDDFDPCTADACAEPAACTHTSLEGKACDDGSACTVDEVCNNMKCHGNPAACDDGDPCTLDLCSAEKGCLHPPSSSACSDGSACTVGDMCSGGLCVSGGASACDDGVDCTLDACKDGACVHQAVAFGSGCWDGDYCTEQSVCTLKGCVALNKKNCSDGNACTLDWCTATGACQHAAAAVTATCDDGDACTTGDHCTGLGNACTGTALECGDGNPCTDDTCTKGGGCVHLPSPATACSDGNACTGPDSCKGGKCAGPPLNCSDSNACTADGCVPPEGCVHVAIAGAGACDDGNVCTAGDTCDVGKCTGQAKCLDTNPCTLDQCLFGECIFVPLPAGATCTSAGCGGKCDGKSKCAVTVGCGK